ncbi:MAG: DUF1338 domain-containing protein [Gloeobacterales cyanobacterium]
MKKGQITQQLWQKLWEDYKLRVSYARIYEDMLHEVGGMVVNDHIAFRSLRLRVEGRNLGIAYLESVVKFLGYEMAGEYIFPDQKLYARHYQHPEQEKLNLPKLFISELMVELLPEAIAKMIEKTVTPGKLFDTWDLERWIETAQVNQFQKIFTRPWPAPLKSVVEAVHEVSQYGAWVLIHGYAVNHFTGYINRQHAPQYPDIESTTHALAQRGIPMKATIEGNVGSGLRQTATQAVTEMVPVYDDASGLLTRIPWPYAYYEIAERNVVEVAPGQKALFEGFLGPQARNLFEMTRKQQA